MKAFLILVDDDSAPKVTTEQLQELFDENRLQFPNSTIEVKEI